MGIKQLLDEDPKMTIRNLLLNNWDTSNTSISTQPKISTGWWDKSNSTPQVSVTNRKDVGEGATFNESGGKGVGRDETTSVLVTGFAQRQDGEPNPKTLSFEFMQEVVRIVGNNAGNIGDFYLTTADAPTELPPGDPEGPPSVFAYQVTVTGRWLRTFYQP